jgi:hypothetical protein
MPSNEFVTEFALMLQSQSRVGQQGMKIDVQADSTKEMVLRNMPEILLTLFPVKLGDGELSGVPLL